MVMFTCIVVVKLVFEVTTCCYYFLFQSLEGATLHFFSSQTKRSKLSEPLKDVLSELAKLKASANFETQHKEGSQHEGENQNEESEHEDSYLKSSKA
jgi:TRAP-type mannitol/chloroaromatic compound transport system substrate-binding protein